jgi:hypothetical protein
MANASQRKIRSLSPFMVRCPKCGAEFDPRVQARACHAGFATFRSSASVSGNRHHQYRQRSLSSAHHSSPTFNCCGMKPNPTRGRRDDPRSVLRIHVRSGARVHAAESAE